MSSNCNTPYEVNLRINNSDVTIHLYVDSNGKLRPVGSWTGSSNDIPAVNDINSAAQRTRRTYTRISDERFVSTYCRYANHANGTYKIAEMLERAPYAVHGRALRMRDLGVRLPQAYYNRSRARIDVKALNAIVRRYAAQRRRSASV